MPGDRLEELQLARLKKSVEKASTSVFYGELFKKTGLDSNGIKSLEDIRKIPLTTKDDLREHWPYGFLAVSKDKLVRMHSSSGTTGRATVIFHTIDDIKEWTNIVARSMYMTGMRRSDVFQNMMTYALFTGGLGFHYGAERLGALVIPIGAGRQYTSSRVTPFTCPQFLKRWRLTRGTTRSFGSLFWARSPIRKKQGKR